MKLYPNVTIIFILWLTSLIFVAYFGFLTLPHSGNFSNDFPRSFSNWDGGYYISIAQYGYQDKSQYAFFPLYPIAIKAVAEILDSYFLAALVVSISSTLLGLHLLYKLTVKEFGGKIAEKVILLLLLFPTSFYFITAYSEGLFFLLAVATFYFLRSGKLLAAILTSILVSGTRLAGLAVVLSLLFEVYQTTGFNKKNWFVIFSPLGFILYCWFLFSQTGDPFYFTVAERNWQRTIAIPGVSFLETIRNLSTPGFISQYPHFLTDLIFAVFGAGMVLRSFRFLPKSFAIYSLISISLPMFTPLLSSMPRFLLQIFPIFILIALVRNKYVIFVYQLVSVMLLGLFVTLFINGYWVS